MPRELINDEIKNYLWQGIEFEPEIRTFRFADGYDFDYDLYGRAIVGVETHNYQLALPYLQIWFRGEFSGMATGRSRGTSGMTFVGIPYMTFTNKPVEDVFEDQLYFPPLPNLQGRAVVCNLDCEDIKDSCEQVFGSVWTGDNTDAGYDGPTYLARMTIGPSYHAWAEFSKQENALEEILKTKWYPSTTLEFQDDGFYEQGGQRRTIKRKRKRRRRRRL